MTCARRLCETLESRNAEYRREHRRWAFAGSWMGCGGRRGSG